MLTIEEYIGQRKREAKINEFEVDLRIENMKSLVNYVFDYFNNYLNSTKLDELNVFRNEELENYLNQLIDYSPEVREWLVGIYNDYGKQMNRYIVDQFKDDRFFFLYHTEGEFRNASAECYSNLVKTLPFIEGQIDMIYCFIKEYHRVDSENRLDIFKPLITEDINKWIENTWEEYRVNILAFAYDWVNSFFYNDDIWPSCHKKKIAQSWRDYDYDYKQISNLFNIDTLYSEMPKKAFTEGRKQEFEILFMCYWLRNIVGDLDYWGDYLNRVLPALKNNKAFR